MVAPVWDSFVHVLKTNAPLSFPLLSGLPKEHAVLLLGAPAEVQLKGKMIGWAAAWGGKEGLHVSVREALGLT